MISSVTALPWKMLSSVAVVCGDWDWVCWCRSAFKTAAAFASSSSGDLVLVGRSAVTKW